MAILDELVSDIDIMEAANNLGCNNNPFGPGRIPHFIHKIDFITPDGGTGMAGQITISTAQVAEIATTIEGLNKRLMEQLETGRETIHGLANVWDGEASRATIEAFEAFANGHFQNYYDVIDSYVKFLRSNVVAGYEETETANTSLAESFK